MSREEEREFLVAGTEMVEAATGQRPIGYNCNWLRRGPNTLSLLQELGYLYHIDDLSRDEPFIEPVDGKEFVVVPIRCGITIFRWSRAATTLRRISSNRSRWTSTSFMKKPASAA